MAQNQTKKKMKLRTKFALATAGAAAFTSLGWAAGDYNSESTVQATVNHTVVNTHGSDRSYVVVTDKGTFSDNNSVLKMKFNSKDIFTRLQPNCTYQFDVHGWRSDLLKSRPNIDNATFVPTVSCPVEPQPPSNW